MRDLGERRTVAIIGDSMIKDLNFKDFQSRCPKEKIYERNPDAIFLHIGTNSLKDSKSSEQTANEILELAESIKTDQNEVVVQWNLSKTDTP